MGILSKIFTWWNGATVSTSLLTALKGDHVGTDAEGNEYYRRSAKGPDHSSINSVGRERRWVIYNGANDASRVPPEWHGWLHGTFDDLPESHLPPARIWETEYTPNATGTPQAYLPQGALEMGGRRAPATGDYDAWTPEV